MISLLNEAAALEPYLIALRRDLHRHPELGRHEFQTAQRVERELRALGLQTRRIAGTGVIGFLRGKSDGPCIALRADMDALPIQERCDSDFSSECPGVMHACGHDMHTAALIGAAGLLVRHRAELHGSVRFLFQPDEEGDGGAQRMIDEGCMEDVSAVFGAHIAPELSVGTVGVRFGKAYAASNPFDIVLRGRSAHGAEPHLGADAIVAASALVGAIQTLVSREVSPLDPAVISIGSFHAGTARNIIADEAHISGIIRCFGAEMRAHLTRRLTALAEGIAAAHGVRADVRIQWGYSGIINDAAMTALIRDSAASLLGQGAVTVEQEPSLTTEDFGAFLEHAPGSFWHIGVGRSDGPCVPLHNPHFNPDESALRFAAALHAQVAMDALSHLSKS